MSNAPIGIVDAPVHPAISDKPAKLDSASQVGEAATETQLVQVAEAAPAAALSHNNEVKAPVEKKGIVDVLFTSFIIQ